MWILRRILRMKTQGVCHRKTSWKNSRWITGPDVLKEPVDSWLKEETYEHDVDPDSPKVKNVRVNSSAVKESSDILKRLQRFSSWQKAKMAVVLCLKYKKKLRGRVLAKRKGPDDGASEERPTSGTSASPERKQK